jgi:hypothetical protein
LKNNDATNYDVTPKNWHGYVPDFTASPMPTGIANAQPPAAKTTSEKAALRNPT